MMHAKSVLIASVCAALLAASSVQAAPKPPKPEPGTMVTLPVTASVEVENDQAVVELYVVEQSADISAATHAAVERAALGMKELKSLYPEVEFKTLTLSSTPRYSKPKEGQTAEIVGWEVRQSVSAKINDVKQAAVFVQTAQKHFAFGHVGFQLSAQARESVQDQLVRDVIANLKEQAAAIAEAIAGSKSQVAYESVDFHNAAYERSVPYRVSADMLMAKAANATSPAALPVFEPGVTTLTRSLTAKVRIKPAAPKKHPKPTPRPELPK